MPDFQFPRSGFPNLQHHSPPIGKAPKTPGAFTSFAGFLGSGEANLAIEGQASGAAKEEHHGHHRKREDVVVDSEALVDADGEKCCEHVDGDQSRCKPGEQSEQEQDATSELSVGGHVAEPVGKSEGDHVVAEVVQRSVRDDFLVAMDGHGEAEGKPHKKCAPGLQAIEPLSHSNGVPSSLLDYRWSCRFRVALQLRVSEELRVGQAEARIRRESARFGLEIGDR
jgi:hypothetical protein